MQVNALTLARRRGLLPFAIGPVVLCAAVAVLYRVSPWPTPAPGVAALVDPAMMGVLLAAGALGVVLAPAAGVRAPPPAAERRAWALLLLAAAVPGLVVGAVQFGVDVQLHLSETAGRAMGLTWINVPFPGSLATSVAAAVLLECFYRIAPIPILTWLVSGLLLRGKRQAPVFWTAALLTSLIEPAQQIGPALHPGQAPHTQAVLLGMTVLIFAFNLLEAAEFKRWGWPAPMILRFAFYSAFHVVGPYLLPSTSFLYPGPK